MANGKLLKEYLVDENNGYLLDSNNNGKVIMLSGKWGSGKTHFWKNDIATVEFKQKLTLKKSAYSYVSLYGKSSIEEIENNILAQIYFNAIGGDNLITKTFSTFTKYSKRYGNLFSSFDFSKLAEGLEDEQKDNKERVALERLKNGAIICFDDFERKSKDIDLNDLFGFITNLTIEFKCKVVIILNDDVFEGEEKKIFSNVKEKSVSKFLKYEPSIRYLFNLIFYGRREDNKKKFKYLKLRKYKQIILKTIEETEELNARIYIQVLDNLVEWIEKNQEKSDKVLRCLILVNINFVLYHTIFFRNKKNLYSIKDFFDKLKLESNNYNAIKMQVLDLYGNSDYKFKFISDANEYIMDLENRIRNEQLKSKFFELNKKLYISKFFANKLDISRNVDDNTFQKINNFIETGILINE